MPEKLTDSEIMEALKHCANGEHCRFCRFRGITGTVSDCSKNFLDLINRLQAENERLKNAYKQCAWERDTFEQELKTAKAEAYKECIEKVSNIITEIYNKHIFGDNDLEAEEKDAIINFSDDVTYAIDNLLKELVGESSD